MTIPTGNTKNKKLLNPSPSPSSSSIFNPNPSPSSKPNKTNKTAREIDKPTNKQPDTSQDFYSEFEALLNQSNPKTKLVTNKPKTKAYQRYINFIDIEAYGKNPAIHSLKSISIVTFDKEEATIINAIHLDINDFFINNQGEKYIGYNKDTIKFLKITKNELNSLVNEPNLKVKNPSNISTLIKEADLENKNLKNKNERENERENQRKLVTIKEATNLLNDYLIEYINKDNLVLLSAFNPTLDINFLFNKFNLKVKFRSNVIDIASYLYIEKEKGNVEERLNSLKDFTFYYQEHYPNLFENRIQELNRATSYVIDLNLEEECFHNSLYDAFFTCCIYIQIVKAF